MDVRAVGTISDSEIVRMSFVDYIPPITLSLIGATLRGLKVTEDGKINTYGIGEVFWESGKLMQVENVGKEPAELIIFDMAPGH